MEDQYYKSMENTVLKNGDNSYVLKKLLASGGQGGVYLALIKKNSQQVALKLQTEIQPNEERILQLLVKKQQQMNYNVKIYEMFKYQTYVCVIMEFANGGNLYDYIQANQDLPITNRIEIVRQISFGVQEMHQSKLIHRDIKPENIVVFNEDNGKKIFKLCDTGLIKMQSPDFKDVVGIGTGTPPFQAPEMIESMNYNEKVDIWAFGAVIYEIFTCQPLFFGNTPEEIYSQIQAYVKDPRQITTRILSLSLPSDIAQLIIFMIHPNPLERPNINDIVKLLQPKIKILPKQSNDQQKLRIVIIKKDQVAHQIFKPEVIQDTQLKDQIEEKAKLLNIQEDNSENKSIDLQANNEEITQKIQTLQHFKDLTTNLTNDNQLQIQQLELEKQQLQEQINECRQENLRLQTAQEYRDLQIESSRQDKLVQNTQIHELEQKEIRNISQIFDIIGQRISIPQNSTTLLQVSKIELDQSLQKQLDKLLMKIEERSQNQVIIQQQDKIQIDSLSTQLFKLKNEVQRLLSSLDVHKQELQNKTDLNSNLQTKEQIFLNIEVNELIQQQIDEIVANITIMKQIRQPEFDRMKNEIEYLQKEHAQYKQIIPKQDIEITDKQTRTEQQLYAGLTITDQIDQCRIVNEESSTLNKNNEEYILSKIKMDSLNNSFTSLKQKLQCLIERLNSQIINLNEFVSRLDNIHPHWNQLPQTQIDQLDQTQHQLQSKPREPIIFLDSLDLDQDVSQLEQQLSENYKQIQLLAQRIGISPRSIIYPKWELMQSRDRAFPSSQKNSELQKNESVQHNIVSDQADHQFQNSIELPQNLANKITLTNIITGILYVGGITFVALRGIINLRGIKKLI